MLDQEVDDGLERLFLGVGGSLGAELGKERRVLGQGLELVEAEIVDEERAHPRFKAGARDHAIDLFGDPLARVEFAARCRVEQPQVRAGIPQEEAELRGTCIGIEAQTPFVIGIGLDRVLAEQELRRRQHRRQAEREAGVEAVGLERAIARGRNVGRDLVLGEWTPVEQQADAAHELPDAGIVRRLLISRLAAQHHLAMLGLDHLCGNVPRHDVVLLHTGGRDAHVALPDGKQTIHAQIGLEPTAQFDGRAEHVGDDVLVLLAA
jgi:hypothetical protein